jgi:hypothetical protein
MVVQFSRRGKEVSETNNQSMDGGRVSVTVKCECVAVRWRLSLRVVTVLHTRYGM